MKKQANGLSFYDHIDELRERCIKSFLSIIAFAVVAYQYKEQILAFLTEPIDQLIFTSPADAFIVQITLSLFVGLLLASPIVLYQTWQFIRLGLKETEKKFVYFFGPASLVLFVIGIFFAYYVFIPFSLSFLLSFSNDMLVPMITVKSYLSFVVTMILAFGVIFEFPLVILFLTNIGIATPAFLVQKRKYAIVLIFITSALITPPDLITQWIMAIPLMILYEMSIVVAKIVYKRKLAYES